MRFGDEQEPTPEAGMDFGKALQRAYERGRLHGLQEAADIADNHTLLGLSGAQTAGSIKDEIEQHKLQEAK